MKLIAIYIGDQLPIKKLQILEVVPLVVEIHEVGNDFIV
jgi:hypothetical protein